MLNIAPNAKLSALAKPRELIIITKFKLNNCVQK